VNVQKPKVFQLQAPNQGLCPDPQTPYYRGLALVFGGLQLFNAGALFQHSKE